VGVEDCFPSLLPLEKANWYYFSNLLPLRGGRIKVGVSKRGTFFFYIPAINAW
jgi:hypothetical protein